MNAGPVGGWRHAERTSSAGQGASFGAAGVKAAYCYQLVLVVRSDTLGRSDRALSGFRIRVERHCDDLLCYVWSAGHKLAVRAQSEVLVRT